MKQINKLISSVYVASSITHIDSLARLERISQFYLVEVQATVLLNSSLCCPEDGATRLQNCGKFRFSTVTITSASFASIHEG